MRWFTLSCLLLWFASVCGGQTTETRPSPDDNWEVLIEAMIWVESRGKADAVNKDCVGILQIRPIYVADVNRILKEERYTLADRLDPQKSREMFDIVQKHYNPTRDHNRAIHLHNPTEKTGDYKRKILTKYNEIKQSNQRIPQ